MSILNQPASIAKAVLRRGTGAALGAVDAGLHPTRTLRQGVQHLPGIGGLVGSGGTDRSHVPAPTDAAAPAAPAAPVTPAAPTADPEPDTAADNAAAAPETGPDTSESSAAVEPFEIPEEPIEVDADAVVELQGPAPHLPASIAAEIEREYGDDVPGFHDAEPVAEED
jgi:hypothetical protein